MIILSAGHFPEDPGACFQGFCENGEAVLWVKLIHDCLSAAFPVVIAPSVWLGDKVRWINDYRPKPKLVAEIHFNSDASRKGKGSETLYYPRSIKGQKIAQIVQDSVASFFPPNRGIKEGWYRMDKPGHIDYPGDVEGDEKVDYYLKKTNYPAIIVEPEFIHNKTTILAARDETCEVIAHALYDTLAMFKDL